MSTLPYCLVYIINPWIAHKILKTLNCPKLVKVFSMPRVYETSHEYQKKPFLLWYQNIALGYFVCSPTRLCQVAKLPSLYLLCPQLHVILPNWLQACSPSPFCKVHIIFTKFLFHFVKLPNEHHCVINATSLKYQVDWTNLFTKSTLPSAHYLHILAKLISSLFT